MSVPPGILLPAVTRLSPRVVRVLGMNPGPFTLGGTNTYIVGTGRDRLLIDTGEGRREYLANIDAALADNGGQPAEIATVLLTHHHGDHVGGVAQIAAKFPRATFYKHPSATDDGEVCSKLAAEGFAGAFVPIAPEQTFAVEGATLTAIAAPGHTDDHVCFLLHEEQSLFTGDVILGVGSSVFARYGDYMATLRRLRDLAPSGRIYPGHAEVVECAIAKIDEYIEHRNKREVQLIDALAAAKGASLSILEIVRVVYADTPAHLHAAAGGNMLQYLRKLLAAGRVRCVLPKDVPATVPNETLREWIEENEYITAGEGKTIDRKSVV